MDSQMDVSYQDSPVLGGRGNFSRRRSRSSFGSEMSPAPSKIASDFRSPFSITTENMRNYESPPQSSHMSSETNATVDDFFDDGSLTKYLRIRKPRNGRSKPSDSDTLSPMFPDRVKSICEPLESCGLISPVNTTPKASFSQGSMLKYLKIQKRRTLSPDSSVANERSSFAVSKDNFSTKDHLSLVSPIRATTIKEEDVKEVPKCTSPNPADIAIEKSLDNPNLIGDFSKDWLLPTIIGKNKDMPSITPLTVVNILKGKYDERFMIIDCRYPYEYEGGHINGAKNFYIKKAMSRQLFPSNIQMSNPTRPILIFHCEFSSKRGPDMYRFVRNKDRQMNADCYPELFYPEMYVLEGGYAAFFAEYKDYCDPKDYKKMLNEENSEDMSHFRAECKFNDGKRGRRNSSSIRTKLLF